MSMTSILYIFYVVRSWHVLFAIVVVPIFCFFLLVELLFFSSNIIKFGSGGWVPLVFGAILIIAMGSWALGRATLCQHQKQKELQFDGLKGM
jgi:KUP system potassium uptake protein